MVNRNTFSQEMLPLLPPLSEADLQRSIVARFEQAAQAYPDHTALTGGGQALTYTEVDRAAGQVARAIQQALGPRSEPVALLLPHAPQAILAMLGVMKAGKAYVPVDPFYPPAWITHILDNTQARLVLTDSRLLPTALTSLASPGAAAVLQIEPILAGPEPAPGELSSTPGPADLAYILYTSGSTGVPKGAMHTHQDVMANLLAQSIDLGLSGAERFALHITFGFEPSRFTIYSGLLHGGTVCLYDLRAQGLNGLAEWIGREQINFLVSTPSTFRHMLGLDPDPAWLRGVRQIILGGETVTGQDVALFQRFFAPGSTLINVLGMTETGIISRYKLAHGAPFDGLSLPAGAPIGDKRLHLLDENGAPCPPGEAGEIVLSSRYLSPGYWRQPGPTSARFTPDPTDPARRRFHTGDLGRLRPDQTLEYLGRKDAQIKIRGYRVDPAEIEGVIQQVPGVQAAAVIARDLKRGDGDRQLVAYVESRPAAALSKADLRAYLAGKLPAHMVPPLIVFLDALPLTPTGKINRQALPEPEALGQGAEHSPVPPRDGVELQLTAIWEKTLKTRPIGVQDDYFELGGNSLLAAQLFTQIEKTFGRKLPLASLFQAPTIEQQAAILRSDTWTPDWSSLVLLRAGDDRPPLFFAAPVGGNVLSYHDLLAHLDPAYPVYGLQALGLDGAQGLHRSVKEIAGHYLQEIYKVQPHGPYYLLGSSFGGLVAYEMAERLHAQGEEVALVVMFDAYGPGYPSRLPGTNRARRKLYKLLQRVETHWGNLGSMNWPQRMIYLRVKLPRLAGRIRRRVQARLDALLHPLPAELRKVRAANLGAARSAARKRRRGLNEPRRCPSRLVLFRASRQPWGIYPDPKLGWGRLVGEAIEVYELPGHHTSIIYEPRAGALAQQLNKILSAG